MISLRITRTNGQLLVFKPSVPPFATTDVLVRVVEGVALLSVNGSEEIAVTEGTGGLSITIEQVG